MENETKIIFFVNKNNLIKKIKNFNNFGTHRKMKQKLFTSFFVNKNKI